MSEPITLTNGAAHWGYHIVSNHKSDLEDLFFSGSVALKLKAAKRQPLPKPDETQADFAAREDEWQDTSFGAVEFTDDEREYLRKVFKAMSDAKTLPNRIHVAEFAAAIGLKK